MAYGNKSDSPGKMAARAVAYDSISRKDFWTKKHIVIASRECGDIRYLLSMGVSPDNIIACDTDPSALTEAMKLGVHASPLHSIEETVRCAMQFKYYHRIASINVDLCFSMVKGLPTLISVCRHINPLWNGKLFYTFERARDKRYDLRSTKERIDFLCRELHLKLKWIMKSNDVLKNSFEYVSFTSRSEGSPMLVCILK